MAYERARDAFIELAPYAAEKQVHIGVENIWNKFLLSPLEMRTFIDEIDSQWVGVYSVSYTHLDVYKRQGVEPALVALDEAGIPIIVVDSGVERDDLISTFVASNNYQAGFNNGEELKKNFPDGAKIAAINNPNADSVVQRYKGDVYKRQI